MSRRVTRPQTGSKSDWLDTGALARGIRKLASETPGSKVHAARLRLEGGDSLHALQEGDFDPSAMNELSAFFDDAREEGE
jgi:hypothetical protein